MQITPSIAETHGEIAIPSNPPVALAVKVLQKLSRRLSESPKSKIEAHGAQARAPLFLEACTAPQREHHFRGSSCKSDLSTSPEHGACA